MGNGVVANRRARRTRRRNRARQSLRHRARSGLGHQRRCATFGLRWFTEIKVEDPHRAVAAVLLATMEQHLAGWGVGALLAVGDVVKRAAR